MGKLALLTVTEEAKDWLADLSTQLDRAEKLSAKGTKGKKAAKEADGDEDSEEEEESDEDFAAKPKRGRGRKAKGFEEDEEETSDSEDDEEASDDEVNDDEEEASDEIDVKELKKGRGKKLTADDVNDACKACAKRTSRDKVLSILKKKFEVESISDLDPSDYADAIKAMTGK